jgi:O-antigen/teichoic acid export membrane protein
MGYNARLVKGLLWLGTAYLGIILSNFVVARMLPQQTFGEYQFFVAVLLFLAMLTLPGANMAIVQSVATGHDGSLVAGVRARVRWSLAGSAVMVMAAGYYAWRGDMTYAGCSLMVAAALPFYHPFDSYSSYYAAKQQFDRQATCLNAVSAATCLAVIVLATTGAGLMTLLAATFGLTGALNYGFYRRVRRSLPADSPPDPALGRYARQMSVYAALIYFVGRFDHLLLFFMLGPADLATYAIAISIPEQLATVADVLRSLLLPSLTQHGHLLDFRAWRRRMLLPSVLGVVATVAGIVALPWVLHVLFAGKYDHAAPLAQWVFIGVATVVPQKILQVFIESQKAVRSLHQLQYAGGIVKIGVLVATVPFFGLGGAVSAVLLMRLALLAASWWFTRNR